MSVPVFLQKIFGTYEFILTALDVSIRADDLLYASLVVPAQIK